MEKKIENISELITALIDIRNEHGNLSLLNEYDADYWIGYNLSVENKQNPDTKNKEIMLIIS